MFTKTYSIATDFIVGNGINISRFHMEVGDSSLGPKFVGVSVTGDVVDVDFTTTLDAGEITVLDGIVAVHDGSATVDTPLYGYLTGLRVSPNPTNPTFQVDVARGAIMGDFPNSIKLLVEAKLTADLTVTGPGGRNAETAEQIDKWYALFVIGDVAGMHPVKTFLVNEDDLLTYAMPTGYDTKARVGWVRNDASSNIIPFRQLWNGTVRRVAWDLTTTTGRVLTSGNATVFTDVDLSTLVPPTAENSLLLTEFETGASGSSTDELKVRPAGFAASTSQSLYEQRVGLVSADKCRMQYEVPCPGQKVQYRVDSAASNSAHISVTAWDDELSPEGPPVPS